MGNTASESLSSYIKRQFFNRRITGFLDSITPSQSIASDSQIPNIEGIIKSNLKKNLNSPEMLDDITTLLLSMNWAQMIQYNSENLYQIILFPYLYHSNHNENFSITMNEKTSQLLNIDSQNFDRGSGVCRCRTFSSNEGRELMAGRRRKTRATIRGDRKLNLSFDDLNVVGTDNEDLDACETILMKSKADNYINKRSIIEEEKNNYKSYKKLKSNRSSYHRSIQNQEMNGIRKGYQDLKKKYSNAIRSVNIKNYSKQASKKPIESLTMEMIKNVPKLSNIFSLKKQNDHESSLRNYLQENLSPDNVKRSQKSKVKRSRKVDYKIDLSSKKFLDENANINSNSNNKNKGFHYRIYSDVFRSSVKSSYKKKKHGTKKKALLSPPQSSEFKGKIDLLLGVNTEYNEKINEHKKMYSMGKRNLNDEPNVDSFQTDNNETNLQNQLDFLDDFSTTNNFNTDNTDQHDNLLDELKSPEKGEPKAKYLDMPSTKKKIELIESAKVKKKV